METNWHNNPPSNLGNEHPGRTEQQSTVFGPNYQAIFIMTVSIGPYACYKFWVGIWTE